MDLKYILNEVLAQSGFLQKAAFASSADPDDVQMLSIANRVAYEIMNMYNWSCLRKDFTINMIEQNVGQGKNPVYVPVTHYNLPTDFQTMVPDSAWENEGSRRVEIPTPETRWFLYKFSAFSDGGTIRARIYCNQIEVHDPEPGESFTFEYISKYPITDFSGGVPKPMFTLDTDLFLLDDELLTLGVQAHWQQTKMMPQYQEHMVNYRQKMNEAIGRDSGGRTIGGRTANSDWMRDRGPYYPLYRS